MTDLPTDGQPIEAVPTEYSGTTFRSRLEADWARTLDTQRILWQYEPERVILPSGAHYLPAFWLPEIGTWLEVKGPATPRKERPSSWARRAPAAATAPAPVRGPVARWSSLAGSRNAPTATSTWQAAGRAMPVGPPLTGPARTSCCAHGAGSDSGSPCGVRGSAAPVAAVWKARSCSSPMTVCCLSGAARYGRLRTRRPSAGRSPNRLLRQRPPIRATLARRPRTKSEGAGAHSRVKVHSRPAPTGRRAAATRRRHFDGSPGAVGRGC